jgi:hypothetical protein
MGLRQCDKCRHCKRRFGADAFDDAGGCKSNAVGLAAVMTEDELIVERSYTLRAARRSQIPVAAIWF